MFFIVQCPVRWTAQGASNFAPGRTVHSDTNSTFELLKSGSSVVECRTRNQVSPGSNPPLLPFRSLGIFVISTVLSWCRNEQVCLGRKSVKNFESSNGVDTALYKNIPFMGSILAMQQLCAKTIHSYFHHLLLPVYFHPAYCHFSFQNLVAK